MQPGRYELGAALGGGVRAPGAREFSASACGEFAVLIARDWNTKEEPFACALAGRRHIVRDAIAKAGVGEFDGNEIAADLSDGTLYMYGPDAEALFQVVRPVLVAASCFRQASATLRLGPPEPGVRERTEALRS
jgi:hypothetical protein